ncbi:hypothetical protein HAHE_04380 [Haloferula helveola]|uniref:Uncharacterized protein n=1 Tax=Haloferula helveola TaxID=490095 RepID=A0ABN6GZ73_9BACT|nr:hypothetical protein HAHE_04380 [Haloferula helveola]
MSFQDNKFPIILGTVTAVAAGGLIFWGMKSGGKYATAKEEFDSAQAQIGKMLRANIPPTQDNAREKEKAVTDYEASVADLQKAFDPLRQPKLENIEPSEFQNALLASRKDLIAKFEASGTEMPETFFLGLGKFSDTLPAKKDTGMLNFEMKAFANLLTKLAEAAPDKFKNAYWPGLPNPPQEGDAVVEHPIELTFSGTEASLRKFLSSLDDSKEYFYIVRTMRVKNERASAPNASDARFEKPEEAPKPADPFATGGFVFPDEDPAPAPAEEDGGAEGETPAEEETPAPAPEPEPAGPTDSGEILKQVLGSEKLDVFLRIDVVQFLEPKTP